MGVKLRYTEMMKASSQIILRNANKDEREEAALLKKSLERYEFVLLVVIISRMLSEINIASTQECGLTEGRRSLIVASVAKHVKLP